MSKKRIVYQPTDIVLAKVKGFPAWPAMIIPEEIIPVNVLKGRPGKPTVDELDDENNPDNYLVYNDLLKFRKSFKPHSSYCVKFFCDDSYIWLKPVDFKPLTPEQCSNWLQNSKKQTKKLIPAYEMAAKGPEGIDVWEFVEYGSQGKPEEEEYVEVPEEQAQADNSEEELLSEPLSSLSESDYDEGESIRKGSRSSKRQANAKASAQRSKTRKRRAVRDEEEDDELDAFQELEPEPKATSRSKNKSLKVKIEIKKYKFEDDGDWSIVGLGPQEPSLLATNSIVSKLSQKKNLELHNELKGDLIDKLGFVNRLITDLVFKSGKQDDSEEYHMLLDELEQCTSLRGSQDELITVFFSDQELVTNLSALFNLKQNFLRQINLYDRLQEWFRGVFGYPFVTDPVLWTLDTISKGESQQEEAQPLPHNGTECATIT
ncbi:LAME_0C03708g1_1 [Lachancea meyersii CBS 8951]|uniref:LAME_0C03708g1_1 n=1 Tax=Lachancea meyersii CBS 8951 TaxID=1266667 RepID=A0A1G4J0K3_9SACH|nr:LAME_0C03708g1_1 [Lachancea meyersii CBS 8951]